jgi:hypothetical protein
MSPDDLYEAWKRSRAHETAPTDFAERILASVRRPAAPPSLLMRVGRFAVCAAACAACLFRIVETLALFFNP